jgi:hypothetical protein
MIKLVLRRMGVLPKSAGKLTQPKNLAAYLLKAEAAVVLVISLYAYFFILKSSILLFILLILAPDLSLAGYALGLKKGSAIYNVMHTYITPGILLAGGFYLPSALCINLSLIWIAHIAQDRLRGFGFKYKDRFEGSHLHNI